MSRPILQNIVANLVRQKHAYSSLKNHQRQKKRVRLTPGYRPSSVQDAVCRMTIVLKGTDMQMEQARRQLEDVESPSTTLLNTAHHLRALAELTRLFHGSIVDVSPGSVIVHLCAKPERITSFMRLCKPFGMIEAARTGVMAMPRSPLYDHFGPQTKRTIPEETNDTVDPTHLPPG